MKIKKACLVYQGGIANVFAVNCFNLSDYGRNAKRLMQLDFRSCEFFARGLGMNGTIVRTVVCNQAGDITHSQWSDNLEEQPSSDKFRPVKMN